MKRIWYWVLSLFDKRLAEIEAQLLLSDYMVHGLNLAVAKLTVENESNVNHAIQIISALTMKYGGEVLIDKAFFDSIENMKLLIEPNLEDQSLKLTVTTKGTDESQYNNSI